MKAPKCKPKHPQRRVSWSDPDAGWLNRTNKPHGMHYLSHQTLDTDHGINLDVAVTAGDASDKTPYLDQIERVMELPEYQQALRKRQIWCERTFAIQKWSHNLTRDLRRGLEAAEDHCLLSAAALNLKRMIKCMG